MNTHRIAYAFVAFDDIDLLEKKIKFLYTAEDYFIVHWNKYSSRKKMRQLQEAFKDCSNVYIYSKFKVIWGMNSILLAMLENMRLALRLAAVGGGRFDHFIALSQQCAPVKTKEYIKAHLAKYKGKSFCGSEHVIPEVTFAGTPCEEAAFAITRYSFVIPYRGRLSLPGRLIAYQYAVCDFFRYLIPILKNSKQTLRKMAKAESFQAVKESTGMKKVIAVIKYIVLFPLRFMFVSLDKTNCICMYGKPSKLFYACTTGTFQRAKSCGPTGCFCYDDVQYLASPKIVKLAKSMKRYFGPEEYFPQTVLYNSDEHRKNFLEESLCATDFYMRDFEVLRYLSEETFTDVTAPACVPRDYKFQHICFVRKVMNPQVFDELQARLLKALQAGDAV